MKSNKIFLIDQKCETHIPPRQTTGGDSDDIEIVEDEDAVLLHLDTTNFVFLKFSDLKILQTFQKLNFEKTPSSFK